MAGEAFRALADPTRRRILELLRAGDLTAGELARHFDISKPSLSHHLGILKGAGLVEATRQGQNIVYRLDTTILQSVMGWFCALIDQAPPDGAETETSEPSESNRSTSDENL